MSAAAPSISVEELSLLPRTQVPGAISNSRKWPDLTRQLILTPAGEAYLTPIRKAFDRIAEATAELKPDGFTNLLHIGVPGGVDMDGLRTRLSQFRQAQLQVAVRISQPAGLHELLEGKIDVLIEASMQRYSGYSCDPIAGPVKIFAATR